MVVVLDDVMHPVHPTRKHHPHSRLLVIEAFIFLAFTLFLFFIVGAATNANPAAVLLGFAPSIIFAIAVIALIQTDYFQPAYSWLVLVVTLVIAALVYFTVPSPLVQGIDAGTVLLMNAILSSVALAVFHQSYTHEETVHEHDLPRVQHITHPVAHATPIHTPVVHEHALHDEDVGAVVHSIEDKVKALNFVIGRVYSVYKGGTERMRSRIRIDKAWYEDFNRIDHADNNRRRAEAVVLLGKIHDRLSLLEKAERDVFGDEHSKLRNLARDPNGSDSIIDVLVRNDKDPVKQYYDGASTYCADAMKKLGSAVRTPLSAKTGMPAKSPKGGLRIERGQST
jgi:hypothetical protein